jgi:hypothetical protein
LQVQSKLGEFLKFLQKNHTDFFLSSYVRASDLGAAKEPQQDGVEEEKGESTL